MTNTAVLGLKETLSGGTVVTDPAVMERYRTDRADLVEAGIPAAVVRPSTPEEVARVMAWASRTGTVVIPRGAGTGLSGGANAQDGGVVLSLERMDAIRSIDPLNQVVEVEAGVVNAAVGQAVAQQGLFYPPDPGSFEVSTIGGNLATNAGGMRCVKYGVTRQSVLGLEAVLADGRILRTGGRTLKDVAGLDLTQLLIGSEGTLGVITSATLRMLPLPKASATFVATMPTLAAASQAFEAIFSSDITPSALEVMDRNTVNAVEDHRRMDLDREAALLVIGQTDGPGAGHAADALATLCDQAGARLTMATTDPDEAEMLMQARRLAGWVVMESGPTVIEDIAVPRTQLGEALMRVEQIAADLQVRIPTVGHAGDGNLHPMICLPDRSLTGRELALEASDRICTAAIDLGGTVTGEHGVGELKRAHVREQLDETSVSVQHAIKKALDPHGILNPSRGF